MRAECPQGLDWLHRIAFFANKRICVVDCRQTLFGQIPGLEVFRLADLRPAGFHGIRRSLRHHCAPRSWRRRVLIPVIASILLSGVGISP